MPVGDVVKIEVKKHIVDDRLRLLSRFKLAIAYRSDGQANTANTLLGDIIEIMVPAQFNDDILDQLRLSAEVQLAESYWTDEQVEEALALLSNRVFEAWAAQLESR